MKIILFIFVALFLGCDSFSQTLPRYNTPNYGTIENAYYKDVNNFQDQFVGTWLYTNGSTSFKVTFKKIPMYYDNVGPTHFYEDFLVGEYQYIENGVEKINTLLSLDQPHSLIYDYNLLSKSVLPKELYPKCPECAADEKRLVMEYEEPATRNVVCLDADFIMRRVVEDNVQKLKVQFMPHGGLGYTWDDQPTTVNSFLLPKEDYILIKQP